jgi:N6-adenosine-specific RNA methylase IME4
MEPFRVVVADPPWLFGDGLPGKNRGAAKNYPCMSLGEICAFEDFHRQPIADDAVLFLWRVSSMVPEAYDVVSCWLFEPKTELVWEKLTVSGKDHFGMGHYLRASHETCIVATRGRVKPLVRNVRSRFAAPVGRHSEKPEEFFKIVESLSPGPYLELFSRRARPGWTCLGNEVEEP